MMAVSVPSYYLATFGVDGERISTVTSPGLYPVTSTVIVLPMPGARGCGAAPRSTHAMPVMPGISQCWIENSGARRVPSAGWRPHQHHLFTLHTFRMDFPGISGAKPVIKCVKSKNIHHEE
jgi:hypothetical protein